MENKDREYSNDEITVFWKPDKCIHATICYVQLLEVFNPRKRPWVNMQGATTDKIIEIVDKCPTDALTYRRKNELEGGIAHPEKTSNPIEKPIEIQIMKDGPAVISGKIKVTDENGKEYKTYSITSFCRCGYSMNQPFCDGMHRKHGWSEEQ